jgi:hypothetical protein
VDPVLTDTYSDMKISDTSFSPSTNLKSTKAIETLNDPDAQYLYDRDKTTYLLDKNFIAPPGQIDDTGVNYSVGSIEPNKTYTIDELIPYKDTIPTKDYIPPYMAEVTQKDINASKMRGFNMMDYDTAIAIGAISPNVTEYEFEQLKQGNITEPGSYTA